MIIPVDLTDVKDIDMIVETLQIVVKRKIPIRFGIVPLMATKPLEDQAKLVYHLWDTYGLSTVFAYLELVRYGPSIQDHAFLICCRSARRARRLQMLTRPTSKLPSRIENFGGDEIACTFTMS